MKKLALIKCLVFVLCVSASYGQKVKYKDIFALLNSKQYEAAEPFLKKYLIENTDNPNAFLYMGIIYQEKSTKDDVLKQTKLTIAHMDSAIMFYDKAHKSLTEKEVKRNSEYYQMYNRRDLRSGEFGVKLSDIQFDLEKKIEGLRERIDRVKMVKHFFALSDSLYKKSNLLFKSIQDGYPGEREFYLRADENTVKTLSILASRFDSCTKAFDQYKSSISTVGKIGYNQTLVKSEIKNFRTDGASPADFYQNEIPVWDYKTFAEKARQAIEKDILPIREHLISYDIEINKLRERLNQDSVSVKNDLTKLVNKLLMEQLKKYDAEPLPMYVFALKVADLEYRSDIMEYKRLSDSTNVHLKLLSLRQQVKAVNRLDSIATRLLNINIDKEAENYSYFVKNTYSSLSVLKSFIKTMKDYAEREKRSRLALLTKCEQSLRWVISATDSIPLFTENVKSRFKPLVVIEEKYTAGLQFIDSLTANGYFFTITPSRTPDVKVTFPVDKPNFKQSRLPWVKSVTYADANGQIYFVLMYSERATKENKYPATLAKIYRSDGLAWSNNFMFNYVPNEIEFKADTGELMVRAGEQQNVIDKNGKVMK